MIGEGTTTSRSSRVLVVDDERHTARLLEFILKRMGYQVAVAHDGESALTTATTYLPDAVLLDLELPRMSGIEVLRQLRERPIFPRMAVIILTARSFDTMPDELIEAGANTYCTKPIAPSTLSRTLNELNVPPVLNAKT